MVLYWSEPQKLLLLVVMPEVLAKISVILVSLFMVQLLLAQPLWKFWFCSYTFDSSFAFTSEVGIILPLGLWWGKVITDYSFCILFLSTLEQNTSMISLVRPFFSDHSQRYLIWLQETIACSIFAVTAVAVTHTILQRWHGFVLDFVNVSGVPLYCPCIAIVKMQHMKKEKKNKKER